MKLASLDKVSADVLERLNDSGALEALQLTPSILFHQASPALFETVDVWVINLEIKQMQLPK